MTSKACLAALFVMISAGTVACAAETSAPAPTSGTSTGEAKPEGQLTVATADGKLSGTFTLNSEKLEFSIVRQDADTYSATVKARALTLDATITPGGASYDGFATANGGETQITTEDRALLAAFDKALVGKVTDLGPAGSREADLLVRTAATWAEWPSTLSLSRRALTEEGRSWTSLCGAVGNWATAQHDCCTHWYDPCTSHNGYGGDGNAQVHGLVGNYWGSGTTYYWTGSAWTSNSYDHAYWPYEGGDCFGRCGAGCGSGTAYTQDCHNHDSCVRNGHWIGSPYCDDEFTSTIDDALYATSCTGGGT